jgi:hypothetical protein
MIRKGLFELVSDTMFLFVINNAWTAVLLMWN